MYRINKIASILLISIALMGFADRAIGQVLFSNTLPDSITRRDLTLNINKIKPCNNNNGEYIAISNDEPRLLRYRLYKLDSVGRVLKSRIAQTNPHNGGSVFCPGNFIIKDNKIFVPALHRTLSAIGSSHNCIMVYDFDLNIIDSITLARPNRISDSIDTKNLIVHHEMEMIYDIINADDCFYLTGFVYRYKDSANIDGTNRRMFFYNSTCLVYKLDKDLKVIWKKEYGDTSILQINMGQKLLFMQDGSITVVNQVRQLLPVNHRLEFISLRSKVNFIKIDTAGHILTESTWPKEQNRWYFRNVSNACDISRDDEIVIGGYYSDSSFSNIEGEGKLLLAKFDASLNLMWEYIGGKQYINNAINKVLIDSGGNILVAGQHDQLHTPMPWRDSVIASGFIAWFSQDGKIKKWSNVYPIKEVRISTPSILSGFLNRYVISDIYPEANGTFTGCGSFNSETLNITSPWFFRIDSNGCLTPECDTSFYTPPVTPKDTLPKDTVVGNHYELFKLKTEIVTTPNPATTQVHIESPIKIESYILNNTSGTSVQGGELDAENNIDVSQLPQGIYFLQLELVNGQRVVKKLVRGF